MHNFNDIQIATTVIQNGGVVAYPTESVFGLGCDPQNISSLNRLLAIKKRDENKGLIIVASKISQVESYIDFDRISEDDWLGVLNKWPGPFTFILPTLSSVPRLLTGNRDTIAIRVSSNNFIVSLCNSLNGPIVSTSCNISGKPAIRSYEQACCEFLGKVDYIVNANVDGLQKPSTIIDAISHKILR